MSNLSGRGALDLTGDLDCDGRMPRNNERMSRNAGRVLRWSDRTSRNPDLTSCSRFRFINRLHHVEKEFVFIVFPLVDRVRHQTETARPVSRTGVTLGAWE